MTKHILAVSAAAILLSAPALGQQSELDRSRLNQAAFDNYTEPGDVAMKVHVWGAVHFPGLYEIPRGSTLSELTSLGGAPPGLESVTSDPPERSR